MSTKISVSQKDVFPRVASATGAVDSLRPPPDTAHLPFRDIPFPPPALAEKLGDVEVHQIQTAIFMRCDKAKMNPTNRGTVVVWNSGLADDPPIPGHDWSIDWNHLEREPPLVTVLDYIQRKIGIKCQACKLQ